MLIYIDYIHTSHRLMYRPVYHTICKYKYHFIFLYFFELWFTLRIYFILRYEAGKYVKNVCKLVRDGKENEKKKNQWRYKTININIDLINFYKTKNLLENSREFKYRLCWIQ